MEENLRKMSIKAFVNHGVHWFSVGMIAPIMTLFLLDKGLSLTQIAFGLATYSGVTILFEIPTGGLADTIGRKRVYSLSIIFFIICSILLIIVNDYRLIILCFIFQGISRALFSGTMDAYFIDEFIKIDPDINLQKIMAKIGIVIPFSLGLGSLVGGVIPMIAGSFTANYVVLIILLFAQLISTNIYIKEEIKVDGRVSIFSGIKQIPHILSESFRYGIKNSIILILLAAGFVWGFSVSGLESLWQPQVRNLLSDSSKTWIFGLLTAGYFFAASIGNLIITPIIKLFKNSYTSVLFLFRLLMGVTYFVLAQQINIPLFSVFYILVYLFNGLQESPAGAIFNREIPSDKRSTLISFLSLFMQLGGIAGSITLGIIADNKSIKGAWSIAALVLSFSSVLYLLIPLFTRAGSKGMEFKNIGQ